VALSKFLRSVLIIAPKTVTFFLKHMVLHIAHTSLNLLAAAALQGLRLPSPGFIDPLIRALGRVALITVRKLRGTGWGMCGSTSFLVEWGYGIGFTCCESRLFRYWRTLKGNVVGTDVGERESTSGDTSRSSSDSDMISQDTNNSRLVSPWAE
jgi:hypothetical protein